MRLPLSGWSKTSEFHRLCCRGRACILSGAGDGGCGDGLGVYSLASESSCNECSASILKRGMLLSRDGRAWVRMPAAGKGT